MKNNKIQYVVIYAHTVTPGETYVPLILKKKPEHLVGMLNLVGGKIEKDEDVLDAAVRELKEETGLEAVCECGVGPEYMGVIEGRTCEIHHVKVPVYYQELNPREDEIEEVRWYVMPRLLLCPNLMPNLRVTIPLCEKGLKDWRIQDFDNDWREKVYHTVTLNFKELNPWIIQVPSVQYYLQEEEE